MASNGSLMVLNKTDFDKLLKSPIIKSISMAKLQFEMDEGDSGSINKRALFDLQARSCAFAFNPCA
jgi:hypothetical protein